jgi:Phytanoyl-CoA dioxygenase (PhyH)
VTSRAGSNAGDAAGGIIERFMADGFVKLAGAVPTDTIEACTQLLWQQIGLSPTEPAGWTEPVRWVGGMTQRPFVDAMSAPALVEACDALAGPGRWLPRASMGSFPLRFPHHRDPEGLGWHIEGSYQPPGAETYWANVWSKDRALLALVLFTDVSDEDGPTRIRLGSHRDVPAVLLPYGRAGVAILDCATSVVAASARRPVVHATGQAGDVFLCHPFLVHAAQANHGTRPRFIGQPSVPAGRPYDWTQPAADCSPVELSIKQALV